MVCTKTKVVDVLGKAIYIVVLSQTYLTSVFVLVFVGGGDHIH